MIDIRVLFKKEVAKEVEKVKKDLVNRLRSATPVDTGEARDGWRVEGDAIVNGVGHISNLNEGSSKQAPSFFVESTVLSHPAVKPSGTIVRSK